jgi:acyl-CoA thioester hydrolase
MSRPDAWRARLAAYPFRSDIATRWADLDPLRHINNVAMAGLFEEGRGRFNRDLDLPRGAKDIRWLIAAVSLNYVSEAHFPQDVTVASGIGHIGARSWTILSGAFQDDRWVAACDTVIVYTDANGPAALPDDLRARLETRRVKSD